MNLKRPSVQSVLGGPSLENLGLTENIKVKDARLRLSPAQRLLMLALNYLPLLHVAAVVTVVGVGWGSPPWRVVSGAAVLYILPALVARVVLLLAPIAGERIRVGTADFFKWWALANLQMVFSRLPMFEELLRLVPGLYSVWLRLWGSRIGRLTYWGAGLRILDRSFLRIGDDVIFGAAVRLNPHVLVRNERGEMELVLAKVVVGDRAVVGGYSLLTAGSEVAADECTRAFLISPPFSRWEHGKRTGKGGAA
jgi:hypothetical protein